MKVERLDFNHLEQLIDFRNKASQESEYINDLNLSNAYNLIKRYRDKNSSAFVILVDETIAGHIFLTFNKGICFLRLICTLNEFKGKGLSDKLMDELKKECKVFNIETIELVVNKTNTRAIKFYNKHGFAKVRNYDQKNMYMATGLE